ncbi:type VI secretion protein [Salmonella bongori]|nr:type VI secretion protein [Salmonella bongori]
MNTIPAMVCWYEGMAMLPQHFQLQALRHEMLTATLARCANPWFWGVMPAGNRRGGIMRGNLTRYATAGDNAGRSAHQLRYKPRSAAGIRLRQAVARLPRIANIRYGWRCRPPAAPDQWAANEYPISLGK